MEIKPACSVPVRGGACRWCLLWPTGTHSKTYGVKKMDTAITLVTQRIESIGLELYESFLKRRLIREDLCAELYENLVHRLKTYRDRHPDVRKVNRSFISTCVTWIVRSLMKREKKRKNHDEALLCLIRNELQTIRAGTARAGMKRFEARICTAVETLVKTEVIKPAHLLFYVLYHAWEVRPEFAEKLLSSAGIGTPENEQRVDTVRRSVTERTGARIAVLERRLEREYIRVYHLQSDLEQIVESERAAEKKRQLEKAVAARKHTFKLLAAVKVVPSYADLSELTGAAWSTIQYGVRRVERLVKDRIRGCGTP